MDGRDGMALSGSSPYYLNRGVGGSGHNSGSIFGPGTQTELHTPPGLKNLSNPNVSAQTNERANLSGSGYQIENSSLNLGQGINTGAAASGVSPGDPGKKKRGRPRKYGPDGANMSLRLSPLSSNPSQGVTPVEKERKNRGRPRGSGRKQRLASLGEWMNNSAGLAFTPHVIHIAAGEDIASKILSFAQQRPRALCILSANGSVSTVTLRQPMSSGSTFAYEGRFQLLCLSGSYLLSEEGGPRSRTGGLSISVCSPDGLVIGGAIGGRLIAASLCQVVVCSFVYDGVKTKNNSEVDVKSEQNSEFQPIERSSTPTSSATPHQNVPSNSGMPVWPPTSRPNMRDPNTEIDLAQG